MEFEKIVNYHHAKISNGPTEALNNLIKLHQTHRIRLHQLPSTTESEHCSTQLQTQLCANPLNPSSSHDPDPAQIRRA